jgi:hypothetical protein
LSQEEPRSTWQLLQAAEAGSSSRDVFSSKWFTSSELRSSKLAIPLNREGGLESDIYVEEDRKIRQARKRN